MKKCILCFFIALSCFVTFSACSAEQMNTVSFALQAFTKAAAEDISSRDPDPWRLGDATVETQSEEEKVSYGNFYYDKLHVASYIRTYDCLPDNYITQAQAEAMGWTEGCLDAFAPGMSIGGEAYLNADEILPADGERTYRQCDIDTAHADSRGEKRLYFSNDGLYYYSEDNGATFTPLFDSPAPIQPTEPAAAEGETTP